MDSEIDLFMNNLAVERGLSVNTISAYSSDLRHFQNYLRESGISLWREVSRGNISGYIQQLGPLFSPRSRARRLAALRTFFRFLEKEGLIEGNPALLVHFPKLGPQLPKALTAAQIESLLTQPDSAKPLGQRDRAMFELLYACGLRVSELAELQLGQVVLQPGYLTVRGKGEKERLVPMGELAAECLKTYLEDGRLKLLKKGFIPQVFINARGESISRQGIWKIIKSRARKAGITHKHHPAHAQAFVCDAPSGKRGRSALAPGNARACGYRYDSDIHSRRQRAAKRNTQEIPPPAVNSE